MHIPQIIPSNSLRHSSLTGLLLWHKTVKNEDVKMLPCLRQLLPAADGPRRRLAAVKPAAEYPGEHPGIFTVIRDKIRASKPVEHQILKQEKQGPCSLG